MSSVQKFYEGSTVFMTGCTGFLGKVLLEKLLRSCSGVKKVYLLVRQKKGVSTQERLENLFESPAFDILKKEEPNFKSKLQIFDGDVENENLGLSENDIETICNEVNCIFHLAATVRFDQKLKPTLNKNVRSVKDLLAIAKTTKNLKAFVYVSTAFSNCNRFDVIEEKYYNSCDLNCEELLHLANTLPEHLLDALTPSLLGKFPNTYVFSKNVAENFLKQEAAGLPLAIVRPSIIISSAKEPMPGWIDTWFGPNSLLFCGGLGVLHVALSDLEYYLDLVPVDFVSNLILVAAWGLDENKKNGLLVCKKEPIIFNCVNYPDAPLKTREMQNNVLKVYEENFRSMMQIMPAFVFFTANRTLYNILCVIFHVVPCYLADMFLTVIGKRKKFSFVKIYSKAHHIISTYAYFMCNWWQFKNENIINLWEKMSERDQEKFQFTLINFDWLKYTYHQVKGIRIYLVKDPLETVPLAEKRYKKIQLISYSLLIFFCLLVFIICRGLVHLFL